MTGGLDSLRRFWPHLMLELTADHLARAGDWVEDAFAFLEALGSAAFELGSDGELIPVTTSRDGDLWFISRENAA